MRVLVFSGTTEGREVSLRCAALGFDTTVSVASGYGRELAEEDGGNVKILENRLSEGEMEELFKSFDCVVDATHPFALEVTANIKAACASVGLPCLRFLRSGPDSAFGGAVPFRADGSDFFEFDSLEDLCRGLSAFERNLLEKNLPLPNVFVSTGSKNLECFRSLISFEERFFFRVLPSVDSIRLCQAAGIRSRNIIAMQGPFSEGLNEAMFRETNAGVLVTKESGRNGGFDEKVSAARKCGMKIFSVRRPVEGGYNVFENIEDLEKELKKLDERRVLDRDRDGESGRPHCGGGKAH